MWSILIFVFVSTFLWAQDQNYILAGKEIFVPKLGSKQALTTHPRLSGFVANYFNRPGSFHGPNCYNTALIASGLFSQNNIRYVSPEEFEVIVQNNFVKVSSPLFKDIIVFDSTRSRGHAAFYLGDELVFHKKSFGTQYHYRIVDINSVGVVEENEWIPGPVDDSSSQMNWPELGKLSRDFYRLKTLNLPKIEGKLAPLIVQIEKDLTTDLKIWAIGRKWGMLGEYFLQELLTYAKNNKSNSYTLGLLTSLKDQVFIMLEEVHFKNRSSGSVLEEICIPENSQQIFSYINQFGKILNLDQAKIDSAISRLKNQDLSTCRLRPIAELLI